MGEILFRNNTKFPNVSYDIVFGCLWIFRFSTQLAVYYVNRPLGEVF